MSRCPQFPEHLFGVDKAAFLKVFLRGKEGSMKGGTVVRGEPVAWIEGQELNLRSLRQLRGLFHHESTIMNSGFDRHAERIPRVLLSRLYVPGAGAPKRCLGQPATGFRPSLRWAALREQGSLAPPLASASNCRTPGSGGVPFFPGHRPSASALGWSLPARWAGGIDPLREGVPASTLCGVRSVNRTPNLPPFRTLKIPPSGSGRRTGKGPKWAWMLVEQHFL